MRTYKRNTDGILRMYDLYPLGDEIVLHGKGIMATWTGEKRSLKKGDWYLSGAIATAYRSKGEMSYPYPIAKLVQIKQITKYEIVEIEE